METQRPSLSLGRWSLWLLMLGLVLPSARAQALSYREAVLRVVDQFNERSSEANLYRLLELDPPPKDDRSARKPVSFRVKETMCPRSSLQPPEQCDFKENGLVKKCVGTVSLDQIDDQFDLNWSNEGKAMAKAITITSAKARAKAMAKAITITSAKARAKAMVKTIVIITVKAKVKFSTVAKTNAKSTSIPDDISHSKVSWEIVKDWLPSHPLKNFDES
ncbi:cathelicidin-4-like [Cervus elaphus]|uniref:cathelicidin-4-like n=1 Tax=Cervus elaphus TaxID=9860 RepID=UPI001CC322CE|nr:cathelicidin-4-like [Cervus elaphus]